VTSALLTPWWRNRATQAPPDDAAGSTDPTRILDWQDPRVRALVQVAREAVGNTDDARLLRAAHQQISNRVHPVYSVNDARPVSRVLARGRGSCSQRLALLEAVARRSGIATRVRGLVVDGRFWYPRFPRLRVLVPDSVLLAWPQFLLDERWVDSSELFGTLFELAEGSSPGFTNAGGETLFEALPRTALDWDGRTSDLGTCSACDLSARVLVDLGLYDSRDLLFREQGQTLSWVARTLIEPILGRWGP
jgi:Transglutaminase-like superfamily